MMCRWLCRPIRNVLHFGFYLVFVSLHGYKLKFRKATGLKLRNAIWLILRNAI